MFSMAQNLLCLYEHAGISVSHTLFLTFALKNYFTAISCKKQEASVAQRRLQGQ
jgi:hypothetical protein